MIRNGVRLGLWAALCWSFSVLAVTPPDQVVKQATDKLSSEIRKRSVEFKAKPKVFYAVVEDLVVPKFDQRYIAQLVMGRNWRNASEAQRKRFTEAFKNQLIRTYADALLEYNDQIRAEWLPLRMEPSATDATVKSKLVRKDAPPVVIGFSLRLKDEDWKIYDITVENISLISSFRGQANSEISESGIDGFITKLEAGQFLKKTKKQS
ncbi:MAG: ABC transporter substrate-binding protein [Pseudomonadota bacterium]